MKICVYQTNNLNNLIPWQEKKLLGILNQNILLFNLFPSSINLVLYACYVYKELTFS